MNKEEGDILPRKQDQERMDRDYEMFLRDVEEDTDLRSTMAVYKAELERKKREDEEMSIAETEEESDDEAPKINMDELLDEFDEMTIEQ